ncbi:hypothetical protein HHK36_021673 [Tetracentron sinense]|uniref:Avr9/Cf-9 rapidly elicited protein 146 n=1 Tax=Tetracentron sinense TaxID=13715 RepID=A0A834YQ54_TETSI|nr:hypothetical protein HHK36_021673 [Tetracentron sinense]
MEPSPPVIAKRMWNIVRIVFFMMRKGISKRRLMMDLHLMMKRGKIAGKAIGNLMFHHHSTFSCRPNDAHLSFVSPREYEFSCSNSPAFPFHLSKRKNHHWYSHSHSHHHTHHATTHDDLTAVRKVLEMLNNDVTEASPITVPGFGRSPMVRQLRITDSPFPLRDADEDSHVDKEAGEFIERFYKNLKLQERMAALESSYHDMMLRGAC